LAHDSKTRKYKIVRVNKSPLVVFFPTEKPTYLKFLIQGPYKTTPNRENIPLDDEQNKIIVEATGELIQDSNSLMRNMDYLDINFNAMTKEYNRIIDVISKV